MLPQEAQNRVVEFLAEPGWSPETWTVIAHYPTALSRVPMAAVLWPQVEEGVSMDLPAGYSTLTILVMVVGEIGDSPEAARRGAERLYAAWRRLRAWPSGDLILRRIRAAPTGVEVLNIAGQACSGGMIELTFQTVLTP
ncbi:MAG: hypothetical protein QN210_12335 [Armatimonadota bacterium]|nr:hypothetical protein [Armatimonadota bacterium]